MARVANVACSLDAGHAGHSNVEKREIGMVIANRCDRLFAVLRLGQHLQVRPDFGEPRAKLLAH